MSAFTTMAAIAALGAAGALIRLLLQAIVHTWRWQPATATVIANTLGSFGAGVALAMPWGMWSWLIAVGLMGSVTTLSTLAVDSAKLFREHPLRAIRLGLWHIAGGLVGFLLGYLPLSWLG